MTSLSSNESACFRFLNKWGTIYSGTLYTIYSYTARSVQYISQHNDEAESILLPATSFKVITHGVHPLWPDVQTIELDEIRSTTNGKRVFVIFECSSSCPNVNMNGKYVISSVIDPTAGQLHVILPISKAIGNNW